MRLKRLHAVRMRHGKPVVHSGGTRAKNEWRVAGDERRILVVFRCEIVWLKRFRLRSRVERGQKLETGLGGNLGDSVAEAIIDE